MLSGAHSGLTADMSRCGRGIKVNIVILLTIRVQMVVACVLEAVCPVFNIATFVKQTKVLCRDRVPSYDCIVANET